MSLDPRDGIVRILKPNGETAGTGFVLTADGLLATCSHVVQSNEAQKRGEARPEKVTLVFRTTGQSREAQIEPDWWRSSYKGEDVAILRVTGGLPEGVNPLLLGSSTGTSSHPFDTFGFPKSNPKQGIWGDGHILGETAIQDVRVRQLSSTQVTPGFSGAPVLDRLRHRVVGMVTSIIPPDEYARQAETAFITPIETLREVCPVLKLSDVCPYRNLEAFTEADAMFFRGRARVIELLVDNLQNEPRFLAVFGASGSGKSSVVQAGLIPQLRNGALPASDRWDIIVTRPTDAFFKQHLEHIDQASAPVALIIDQFEELFVSYNETGSEVMTQLTQLLEHSPHVTLLIVMRDDFYSSLVRHETLAMWLKGRVVNVWPTLKREEVEAIVREPAELMGWQFEGGLVETIVDDVLATSAKGRKKDESSTILPLLEFTLTQLWERHRDGILTHEDYGRIGGVTGGLRQWADNAYYTFEERLRPLVRRIFTDLVHLGDEEQHIPDSRRRRPLATLIRSDAERTDITQIVQRLVAVRLLVTGQDQESQQEIVEIIHDALLWEWGLLKRWVEEDRRFLLWLQELERRTRAWVETNTADPAKRDPYKLFGGPDLIEAIEWLNTRASDLREDERAFIQASQERQKQEEQSKKRYTRRMVLVGLAGLGLTVSAVTASRLLFQRNTPPSPLALPYSYRGHTDTVQDVAWSPDGKRLASASWDRTMRVWDASSGQTLLMYDVQTVMSRVVWSSDGKQLASAGSDNTVQVWDASNGQTLLTCTGHAKSVESVAWSPDGRRLASASWDKTVRVWDASNGQTLLTCTGHSYAVESAAWSPDGKWLASASFDKTVRVWDASSGIPLLTHIGHTQGVKSVAWSPDGKRLASASLDKTVRVWSASINSGSTALTYTGHAGGVNSVAWSPDGKRLASASTDNTVRVWLWLRS